VSGPEELAPAAISAVQQWRYRPYFLKGEPVEVATTINVNFQLKSQ
jgi:protein TonB